MTVSPARPWRPGSPEERLVVALDVADLRAARSLVTALRPLVTWFKVGLQLYSVAGPATVELVKEQGGRVFVDLKLHDIPHTVARAAAALTRLGADMISLHAAGGQRMMAEAVAAVRDTGAAAVRDTAAGAFREAAGAFREAAAAGRGGPFLVGVTVLTSLGEEDLCPLGVTRSLTGQVLALARLALKAGLDGWVASPREAALLRRELGSDPLIVTPGIRPVAAVAGRRGTDDQVRVATAAQALGEGADWLVVGRPITCAPDPVQAARVLVEELRQAVRGEEEASL